MTFVVIYDANVLYPSTLRDVLIRLAQTGLVQAKWTETILDETFRSLHANRPDLDETRLQRTRTLMNLAVRDAVVTGYEPLIGSLHLPDFDDRHVLAAAIRARAQIIVTFNLSDFPPEALTHWDVEAKHPDDFLVDQFHLDAISVHKAIQAVADSWQKPPGTVNDVLAIPHIVTASTSHSCRSTLRLSTVIGANPASTFRVGITCATPHSATTPAPSKARTVAIEPMITQVQSRWTVLVVTWPPRFAFHS